MNIFKNVLKVTMVITFLFLFGCEKDQNDSNNNTLTDEIGKVETRYQEGDIKIENTVDPAFQKVETSAPESYKEKIRQDLEKSYSKQTTYLKSVGNEVGVIKTGTCGSYKELIVNMDCEDGSNNISKSVGWVGDCTVNSLGNVTLKFCVVGDAYFSIAKNDFAVLDLNGILPVSYWPNGVGSIQRYFDNEDTGNKNSFSLGGTPFWGANGKCNFTNNVNLAFYYYAGDQSRYNDYCNASLGFSYGVFGWFGNNHGWIDTDDEDYRNANSLIISPWNKETGSRPSYYNIGRVQNIVEGGNNTTLYISKVN